MASQKVLYRAPYNYPNVHECDAAAICCIDFRFWRETMEFIDNYFKVKSYDFPKLPGAAKAIIESNGNDLASSCVEVPCELHNIKKIILVNHEDCGAYGGSKPFEGDKKAEQEFHEQELTKAAEIIRKKYPEKEVHIIYAKLSPENKEIEFIEASNESNRATTDDSLQQAA
ncbi:MAG: carbonic anhydrase [Candidatus Moraniibacteriota bacterium]